MRENVAVLVILPDVPVTVTVNEPVVAVLVAERVKTLLAVAGFVPKAPPTPLGKPDEAKLTRPLKPLRALIEIVMEPEAP